MTLTGGILPVLKGDPLGPCLSQEIIPTEQLKALAHTGKAPGVDAFPLPDPMTSHLLGMRTPRRLWTGFRMGFPSVCLGQGRGAQGGPRSYTNRPFPITNGRVVPGENFLN